MWQRLRTVHRDEGFDNQRPYVGFTQHPQVLEWDNRRKYTSYARSMSSYDTGPRKWTLLLLDEHTMTVQYQLRIAA